MWLIGRRLDFTVRLPWISMHHKDKRHDGFTYFVWQRIDKRGHLPLVPRIGCDCLHALRIDARGEREGIHEVACTVDPIGVLYSFIYKECDGEYKYLSIASFRTTVPDALLKAAVSPPRTGKWDRTLSTSMTFSRGVSACAVPFMLEPSGTETLSTSSSDEVATDFIVDDPLYCVIRLSWIIHIEGIIFVDCK